MPLSSLTRERLDKLEAEKGAQTQRIEDLLCKSAQDLWNTDLDAVSIQRLFE